MVEPPTKTMTVWLLRSAKFRDGTDMVRIARRVRVHARQTMYEHRRRCAIMTNRIPAGEEHAHPATSRAETATAATFRELYPAALPAPNNGGLYNRKSPLVSAVCGHRRQGCLAEV